MNWKIIIIAGLIVLSGNLYAEKPDKALPFHGVISGYLLEPAGVPEGRCDAAPDGKIAFALMSFVGWGPVTHMGETYMYAEHCSYAVDGAPDGTYGQGEFTLVAGNGDILYGTYTNGSSLTPPPVVGFTDDVTFHDGGTGRFTFASGSGVDLGSVDFNDFSFTMQMIGVISYSKK
jgi:hypothetical protein